jgi:ABC-2 type transport system permease protein
VRRVWYIATKELLQTRRDRLAALFTLVLPVLFTIFLGILIGGAENSLPVAIADLDGSPASQAFVERLSRSTLIDLRVTDAGDLDSAVRGQKVAAAVLIPQGFGSALNAGEATAITFIRVETSAGAQSVAEAVQTAVSETNASLLATRAAMETVATSTDATVDATLAAQAAKTADAQLAAPAVTLQVLDTGTNAVNYASGFDQSSSGSLVNWVLFSLLGVASTMVWERRRGLLRRLGVAGLRAREIIGGKMLAMVIITFIQQLLLVLLGQIAFGVHYFNSPAGLLVVMISLSVMAASFGLFVSSLFRTEQAVIATTVICAQLLAAMGGAWFPLEITSSTFSRVAHVLPSAWVMDSLHGIILKDWGVAQILRPMGIVWIWIAALFMLAMWRYRPD